VVSVKQVSNKQHKRLITKN